MTQRPPNTYQAHSLGSSIARLFAYRMSSARRRSDRVFAYGAGISRSVWSACSLLPLSTAARQYKEPPGLALIKLVVQF
jgi:hypothetical protein